MSEENTKVLTERINNLIERFDKLELKMVTKEEFKPIRAFYNRILNWSFGALVAVGSIAIAVLVFFKNKFGL